MALSAGIYRGRDYSTISTDSVDELGQTINVNNHIEADIKDATTGKLTASEKDSRARKYGFISTIQMISSIQNETLSGPSVHQFAQVVGLTDITARLYLLLRFNVR